MTKEEIMALPECVKADRLVAESFWHNASLSVAKYSASIKAAFNMEKKIEAAGLHLEYAWKLAEVILGNDNDEMGTKELWLIAHASALQRVKAALLVANEAKMVTK